MAIYIDGVRVSGGGGTAADVPYDNTDSGLTATDVQEAIDELADNAGSSTLSGLSDVTITSPTTDQVLKYDGSKWVNGTGGNSPVVFSVNASHPNNPTTYDIVVTTGGTTVFSKNYSCTVYGVFAQDTDTFTYSGTTYTVLAQGYQANNGQKMLDFSIDTKSYSVYCSTTNSSYATNDTFTLIVGGSGGVSDYEDLTNKPQVNGVTLSGDKDSEDLGIVWEGTQSQYDAIVTKDPNTTYYITDADDGGDSFQPVIYSEIEREIGVFVDGKPLYEKSLSPNVTSTSFTVDVSALNIENMISIEGSIFQTSNNTVVIPYSTSDNDYALCYYYNNYLKFAYAGAYNTTTWKLKIRYTKTTDFAGSGTWTPQGVPAVHYSTDENIIGTWVDGRTLYEKTIPITNVAGSTGWVTVGSISGIDTMISGDVCVYDGSDYSYTNLPINLVVADGTIKFYNGLGGHMGTLNGYATIRYTKSSS